MGEIAEGILNGDFDERTGEYIGPGQGFPRSMYDDDDRVRRPRQRTPQARLFGVKKFLSERGVTPALSTRAMRDFVQEMEPEGGKLDCVPNVDLAVKISCNFRAFYSWVEANIQKYAITQ